MSSPFPWGLCSVVLMMVGVSVGNASAQSADATFETLANQYLDEFAKFSPVGATSLGDHRYDDQLDNVDDKTRSERLRWTREVLRKGGAIDRSQLRRANQVDLELLKHRLRAQIWRQTELREWAWNPLIYTGLCGDSIYSLMARDFAPARERLNNVVLRLEQFPRFLQQVRDTLEIAHVPRIHAETASRQNEGVLKIIDNMVLPLADILTDVEQVRLRNAIDMASDAIREHQHWLDETLIPAANANYRLPKELYDQKLAFTLHSPLRQAEIRAAAERRIRDLHMMMFEIAKPINRKAGRSVANPASDEQRREAIRFALEQAYADSPAADEVVATAKRSAQMATDFIRERNLISLMPDPLEIILMPEFRQGVSVAYCDSPGPLDVGQKTYYVVSPIPDDWSSEQTGSFLREYNTRSIHVLTIHEALPGHFLQLAHANRYPGKLRHLFNSGTFVEGWACYTEWMMCEQGYLDHDPLMKLITLKWYLRDAMNAILDSAVHIDGISREEGMRMMMDDAFQEEREAAGKWRRAQLTSVQLSTYFVGYLEQVAMRKAAEEAWGAGFDLKRYHDTALSFGAPPAQFVQALMLDQPIPGDNVAGPIED